MPSTSGRALRRGGAPPPRWSATGLTGVSVVSGDPSSAAFVLPAPPRPHPSRPEPPGTPGPSGPTGPTTAGEGFLTVAELGAAAYGLAAQRPGLCRVRRIGFSRGGRPLLVLTVGHAAHRVLVVAGPHANERVGGATALALARRIAAEPALRARTSWDFLLCLDPDGAALAEGPAPVPGGPAGPAGAAGAAAAAGAGAAGSAGAGLYEHYRRFYRPTPREQPEWAPSLGADLPESRALLRWIAERRPALQFSLHGTDVGGTWLQCTRELPGYAESFAASAAARGIPVEVGSYDAMYWPSPGPGVYVMPAEGSAERPAVHHEDARTSTWQAPAYYGGTTVVVEVPLWTSPLVADATPVPHPDAALAALAALLREGGERVAALLEQAQRHGPFPEGPLLRAVRSTLGVCAPLADSWVPGADPAGPDTGPRLTRASLTSLELTAHRLPLRALALLCRLLSERAPRALPHPAGGRGLVRRPGGCRAAALGLTLGLTLGGAAAPPRTEVPERADALLREWCARYEQRFLARPLRVDAQVAHQAAAVLAAVSLSESA